ncbi:MAG: hypothetical protein JST47_01850 [Bacteroidetes bacterium]|nr:hypothetical protein [Bacteroidota bacterium]MBS1972826.1 hypothetical protein [Bacteroidota bacterium]
MKTILKVFSGAVLLSSAILLVNACKKSNTSSPSSSDNGNAANMSANGATADNAYDDAFNIAVQTGYDKGVTSMLEQKQSGKTTLGFNTTGYGYCATVTVKPSSGTTAPFPDTLIVDFGNGCTSADNIARSGSITYIFSGHLIVPQTTISATFNNYTVNGYKLNGTYAIKNTSTSLTSPSFTTTVTGGNIVFPNDTSYSFSGTKTVSVTSSDNNLLDASSLVFSITGNYSISSSYGANLAATVTSPLERKATCHYVDKGVVAFKYTSPSISVNGTLDYGNGTCDNSALVTIGSFTATITIP